MAAMTSVSAAILKAGQSASPTSPPSNAAAAPASVPGKPADELFSTLLERNRLREEHLRQYDVVRTYMVKSAGDKVYATTVVKMQYHAPGAKHFATVSETGSAVVRSLVFRGLMESEVEAQAGRSHRDSSISPHNYTFRSLGEEDADGRRCFVVEASPTRRDKYLFEGKIWIDAEDFAVAKIAGRPAKNPSFWLKKVDFVRQYKKIGEFWLPSKDESVNEVRVLGKRILTIDYYDYVVNPAPAEAR